MRITLRRCLLSGVLGFERIIFPFLFSIFAAFITPVMFITLLTICSACPMLSSIVPPFALSVPRLLIFAFFVVTPVSSSTSLSPYKSTVKFSAAANVILPRLAVIVPRLRTQGATKAAIPLFPTVIFPARSMRERIPFAPVPLVNAINAVPFIKSRSSMSPVDTIMPLTSILERLPKITPFGSRTMTWPFALSFPKIFVGSVPGDTTRFTVHAFCEGWIKFTVAFLPISKAFHSIMARSLDCVIVKFLGVDRLKDSIVPAITFSPVGSVDDVTLLAAYARVGVHIASVKSE